MNEIQARQSSLHLFVVDRCAADLWRHVATRPPHSHAVQVDLDRVTDAEIASVVAPAMALVLGERTQAGVPSDLVAARLRPLMPHLGIYVVARTQPILAALRE